MKKLSIIEQHDRDAVLAYRRASLGGHAPGADSPVARAAVRAIARQEELHPGFDFVKGVLGTEAPIEQGKLPVPAEDAVGITRRSLAGAGAIDLSGHASTIASDIQDGEFLAKLKAAERARAVMADPLFPAAMEKAKAKAVRKGRQPTATDLTEALAEVRAEKGPQPPRVPQPVIALFANGTAAKSTTSSFSVIPDRFGGR